MAHYRSVGEVPPKRHTQFRDPDGEPLPRGADGRGGLLLRLLAALPPRRARRRSSTAEVWELPDQTPDAQPPAQAAAPQAARPVRRRRTPTRSTGPPAGARQQRRPDLATSSPAPTPSPYYRNAIGDECVYVESGSGAVETVFGVLTLPHRRLRRDPAGDHAPLGARPEPSRLYAIEANSHIAPPKRYLSRFGQLLEHAPYCERDLHGPGRAVAGRGRRTSRCWSSTAPAAGIVGTRMTYATHPFDVVGWDGCLYPYTFNIDDYMPITGKIHQPPPVHQVFEGHNFVVCNFLPRKVDYHPLAIPVPYYHSNVDSDEVMFYVGGDYEARKGSGIGIGSISLHPGGYAHGPQPSAIEASLGRRVLRGVGRHGRHLPPLDLGEGGARGRGPGVRLDLGRADPASTAGFRR